MKFEWLWVFFSIFLILMSKKGFTSLIWLSLLEITKKLKHTRRMVKNFWVLTWIVLGSNLKFIVWKSRYFHDITCNLTTTFRNTFYYAIYFLYKAKIEVSKTALRKNTLWDYFSDCTSGVLSCINDPIVYPEPKKHGYLNHLAFTSVLTVCLCVCASAHLRES